MISAAFPHNDEYFHLKMKSIYIEQTMCFFSHDFFLFFLKLSENLFDSLIEDHQDDSW